MNIARMKLMKIKTENVLMEQMLHIRQFATTPQERENAKKAFHAAGYGDFTKAKQLITVAFKEIQSDCSSLHPTTGQEHYKESHCES